MIWLTLAVMLVAAAAVVAWPLIKHEKRLTAYSTGAVVFVLALSAAIYAAIGTPQGTRLASIDDMVAGLDQRLQENPNDLAGWKMLGRSYSELRQFDKAIHAFERAVELESSTNGQTLADLGEAIMMQDQRALTGRAGELFENAIAASPNNPKALFYGGLAAMERGERLLAADRWEALLALSPPDGIQEVLRQRIAELRGEQFTPQPGPETPVVSAAIELAPDATLFVFARDPARPSPPLAAVRRRVSELPAVIAIADSDAMIPGRPLSEFSELEIVARVSMSGQPIAQPGDWYGETTVRPAESGEISIVIDQEVQ